MTFKCILIKVLVLKLIVLLNNLWKTPIEEANDVKIISLLERFK